MQSRKEESPLPRGDLKKRFEKRLRKQQGGGETPAAYEICGLIDSTLFRSFSRHIFFAIASFIVATKNMKTD
jgi:hypothetical protein